MRMSLLVTAMALTLAPLLAAPALAQNLDVIEKRQNHFEAMGKAVKQPTAAFKGQAEFDLAKVQEALRIMQEKAAVLPGLFPDDSKTGGDTEALPIIWAEKADLEARFKKLADAAKSAEGTITDEESFKAGWTDVVGNCGGCHKKFRKPKE